MSKFIVRLLVNALALWVAIQIVPGIEFGGTMVSLLAIAFIFGVVNALVRPLLLLLTCPLILATLGLFVLVVNTMLLALTNRVSGLFDLGLTIDGLWPTFLGALVISVVSAVVSLFVKDSKEKSKKKSD